MPYHIKKWTPEEDEICKAMIAQGASGRTIAERLGRTRAGVLRHLDKVLKIKTRNSPGGQSGTRQRKRTERLERKVWPARIEAFFEPAPPVEGGIAFADLGSDQCRFELSGERVRTQDMRFCGAETLLPGAPYCGAHRQLCYVKMIKGYKAKPFRLQAITKAGRSCSPL